MVALPLLGTVVQCLPRQTLPQPPQLPQLPQPLLVVLHPLGLVRVVQHPSPSLLPP